MIEDLTDKEHFPFYEESYEKVSVRTFKADLDESELIWHMDREDRMVFPLKNEGWKFQMDNEIPFELTDLVFIPKDTYHRLIKGTGELVVFVEKLS